MTGLAIAPSIAAAGEFVAAFKDAYDAYQTFQNNPNPTSAEQFSAKAGTLGAAAYGVGVLVTKLGGPTATSSMLIQGQGIGVGGVSFAAGMASFSEAAARYYADPSAGTANDVLRGAIDLMMGTGNLLMGAGSTWNTGATVLDTRLAAAGIYLVGLGATMKMVNDASLKYDWSPVFNFFDTLATDTNAALDMLADRFSREFLDLALGFSQYLSDLITELKSLFAQAEVPQSPLILDLDGDGIETVSRSLGIHFDHDGNGFAQLTGWVGQDDGLLVRDLDGNGIIDSGAELFGNRTTLASGARAANGFAALADMETNGDGKIDDQDTGWSSLRIWQDADQDGLTDAGELLSLEESGVRSLNLAYTSSDYVDTNEAVEKVYSWPHSAVNQMAWQGSKSKFWRSPAWRATK